MEIKLLVLDVDGTLTDGKIYISANGELMKAFNVMILRTSENAWKGSHSGQRQEGRNMEIRNISSSIQSEMMMEMEIDF